MSEAALFAPWRLLSPWEEDLWVAHSLTCTRKLRSLSHNLCPPMPGLSRLGSAWFRGCYNTTSRTWIPTLIQ